MVYVVIIVALVACVIINKELEKKKGKEKKRKHHKRRRPTEHFLRMISKGYRVYTGSVPVFSDFGWGKERPPVVDHYICFSVLAKQLPTSNEMYSYCPDLLNGHCGVEIKKDIYATHCEYITFDNKTVHRFHNHTGKID